MRQWPRLPYQTAYALNLISPLAKSTVPGAQSWIGFTQAMDDLRTTAAVQKYLDELAGIQGDTPTAPVVFALANQYTHWELNDRILR